MGLSEKEEEARNSMEIKIGYHEADGIIQSVIVKDVSIGI